MIVDLWMQFLMVYRQLSKVKNRLKTEKVAEYSYLRVVQVQMKLQGAKENLLISHHFSLILKLAYNQRELKFSQFYLLDCFYKYFTLKQ